MYNEYYLNDFQCQTGNNSKLFIKIVAQKIGIDEKQKNNMDY